MEFFKDLFVLIGRICLSLVFLVSAYERIKNWQIAQTYMKTKKVPQVNIVLPVAVALQIIGGLSLFFGWHAHIGALILIIVSVFSILWIHAFWKAPESEKKMEFLYCLKTVGIIGGLFLVLALGSGHFGFS